MAEKKFSVIVSDNEGGGKIAVKVDTPDVCLAYPFKTVFQVLLRSTKNSAQLWGRYLVDLAFELDEDVDFAGGDQR